MQKPHWMFLCNHVIVYLNNIQKNNRFHIPYSYKWKTKKWTLVHRSERIRNPWESYFRYPGGSNGKNKSGPQKKENVGQSELVIRLQGIGA